MDDNPENVVEMPFLPWVDVKSTNPVEATGIILFFLLIGFCLYYLFKKKKEEHVTPHIEINHASTREGFSYFDNQEFDASNVNSTLNLPKGVRITLQRAGDEKQYEGTIINITDSHFIVFINNDPEHKYSPVRGEKTLFFAELNDMRWSFSTEFSEIYDEGVRGYIFYNTYDIFITHKRKEARIFKELPSLFSVIPRNIVCGPIPIDDLIDKAQGEIPSTIHDISASGCALHTRSPLSFFEGDLAVISFILPGSPEEHTIFAGVNSIKKVNHDAGGGSILNLEFLKTNVKIDNIIKQMVSSHIEEEIIT